MSRITELETIIENAEFDIATNDDIIAGFLDSFIPPALHSLLIEAIEARSKAAGVATTAHTELNELDAQIEWEINVVSITFVD